MLDFFYMKIGEIMIKKIILTLCLMSIGLSCLADENDYLVVRGFQNLEKINFKILLKLIFILKFYVN